MRACNVASHYTSCQQARKVVPLSEMHNNKKTLILLIKRRTRATLLHRCYFGRDKSSPYRQDNRIGMNCQTPCHYDKLKQRKNMIWLEQTYIEIGICASCQSRSAGDHKGRPYGRDEMRR